MITNPQGPFFALAFDGCSSNAFSKHLRALALLPFILYNSPSTLHATTMLGNSLMYNL